MSIATGEADREFLVARYHNLQEYRQRIIEGADIESEADRRHEDHVRNLVDGGDFARAVSYLDDMARLCEDIDDFAAVELYLGYKKRVLDMMSS